MKLQRFIFYISTIGILFIMSSCASSYFQVYKVESSKEIEHKSEQLVYENDICKVSYNLWDNGGNVGFILTNKSENNVFLHKDKCFFILNGKAKDYYKNRTYKKTVSSRESTFKQSSISESNTNFDEYLIESTKALVSSSAQSSVSEEVSVSYQEKKTICIPPHSSKMIQEFKIQKTLYRDCDLPRSPNNNDIKTLTFKESTSPIAFRNRISYSLKGSNDIEIINNKFYVSEITNYPEKELIDKRPIEFCGRETMEEYEFFRKTSPDKFYIPYIPEDSWDH